MLLYLTRDKFKVTMVCDVWTPRLVLPVLSRCINIFAYHSTVCRNLLHCGVSLHRSFIRLWTSISTVVLTTTPPPATSWRRYNFFICTGRSFAHTSFRNRKKQTVFGNPARFVPQSACSTQNVACRTSCSQASILTVTARSVSFRFVRNCLVARAAEPEHRRSSVENLRPEPELWPFEK